MLNFLRLFGPHFRISAGGCQQALAQNANSYLCQQHKLDWQSGTKSRIADTNF